MHAKEPLVFGLTFSRSFLERLVHDLSDADFLTRPAPGANHIAWQMGHLIAAESSFHKLVPGATPFHLPEGFAALHTMERNREDDRFHTKAEYLELFAAARTHTIELVPGLDDATLSLPIEGRLANIAPTLGLVFAFIPQHTIAHAGQFSVVRRLLGKPVAI